MEKQTDPNWYGLIMAGGGGTRLWPKSRIAMPKQFLRINSENTLLQETYKRLSHILSLDRIYIVTNKMYVEEILKELPLIKRENIIIEHSPKNTAPAIALGVDKIHKLNSRAVIGSFASDHLIKNDGEFVNVLKSAYIEASNTQSLITIGILPTKADEGLGYIHAGADIREVDGKLLFKVKRFTEKPALSVAKAFVGSGEYFWNASYFISRSATFISAYQQFLPDLWNVISGLGNYSQAKAETEWNKIQSIAIDYGIMEKAENLEMITGDFNWSDVGTWTVVSEVFPETGNGNVLIGDAKNKYVSVDSKNCMVYGDGRLIATIGVSDLLIVDTGDAILICHKDKAHDVKKLVEKLQSEDKKEYL